MARFFLANSAITVASVAPALVLGLVWLFRERLHAFALYAAAAAVATSGLATGYEEFTRLATYYPHLSLLGMLGQSNEFAVVGAVVPVALSLAALRKARPMPRLTQPVRRAASALHGESNWFPIEQARRWFEAGGIVIGEAYRPDLDPNLAGKAPLLRYDGNTGSGHVLVFAGSGGYKTTGTVIPSALEWRSGLVCLDPSAEVFRLVYRARRALGHRVAALNPEDPNADSFNALDWINPSSDRALLDLQAVVCVACGRDSWRALRGLLQARRPRALGLPARGYRFRSGDLVRAQDAFAPAPARLAADTGTERAARSDLRQGLKLRLRLSRPARR